MTTLDTFDLQAAREDVLAYCLESVKLGLNFNTQGNISLRIPGTSTFLITPTDLEYDRMTPDDLVVVDEDANVVEGHLLPSSEVTVHLAVYAARPDVQAIVHTEPTYANVFGVLGEPIRGALVNMVIYTKGDVPIMPFALSNSTEFGRDMARYLEDRNAVVWANHGLLTVGPNLRDAFKTSVAVESAAKVLSAARAVTDEPIVLDYASLGITHTL
ncbi:MULTISPECIES: class II aldolase/adducin family protein [Cellulosimicrobium]|uniref:rRNA adenine dimethylase n=2 Tax=Cellulosimicrobium TaxID=157920 RepID=A0A0H2KU34_9MICO|nr:MULTISPECIES: class II aldolase/adducin family protein [Cellulosimicrobium]KLN36658.1 rRNA adenine dimethylase [Cellulosimicrobium funkei]KZM78863.1 rRNA adenine dimethylase [Cellulosimicrobium sp. I38E]MCO7274894.1 class II aldolase/adducin family protein [Cellulosimicrobium cellulans]